MALGKDLPRLFLFSQRQDCYNSPNIQTMNTSNLAYKRIVLKFGTSLLTGGSDHLDVEFMSALAEQVAAIHGQGAEVVIVTSGAVAAGKAQPESQP